MLPEIQKNLSPFIKKGQTLIVGLSGGPDSVFLLSALTKLQKKLGIHLIAAHLNHKLREQESLSDAIFAQKLCKKLNIPFKIKTLDIKNIAKKHKKNLEECGRNERYAFFRELKKKYEADWIITAHHQDDNIETVLMNFTRGCGLSGIAGMNMQNKDILRPLLTISKKRILDFLKKNHIQYREDSTNLNKKFIRNFTRLEIVPRLRKVNPAFDNIFLRNWTYFQELKNFIENLAELSLRSEEEQSLSVILNRKGAKRQSNLLARALRSPSTALRVNSAEQSPSVILSETKDLTMEKLDKAISIRKAVFQPLPPFLQGEILKHIHKKLHGSTESLSKTQIDQVLTLLKNPKTGKRKTFGNVTAIIHSDRIEFSNRTHGAD